MNLPIYIRPLEEGDSAISYAWRNDAEVWKLTGRRPDRVISPEMELEWIRKVLQENASRRFAICVQSTNQYIGNVQLTNIDVKEKTAEFHLFIGAREFWGKGVATQATRLMLDYAGEQMKIRNVHLSVSPDNKAAVRVYEKNGFRFVRGSKSLMTVTLSDTG